MTNARISTVAGLLVGAAGLLLQKTGGVTMPAVPPGLIFLVVAAVMTAVTSRRWTGIVAVAAAGAEIAGFFGSGGAVRLFEVDQFVAFMGSWIRLIGVVVAVAGGVAVMRQQAGRRRRGQVSR